MSRYAASLSLGLVLIAVGLVGVGVVVLLWPGANLLLALPGLLVGVGQIVLLVTGVAWLVSKIADAKARNERDGEHNE